MGMKQYLYREDESIFKKIEITRLKFVQNNMKCTTKDAITYLINRGYEADIKIYATVDGVPITVNKKVSY